MTRYIFVHPVSAPTGNVTIKAGSFSKAIMKFKRANPMTHGHTIAASHDGTVIVHYAGQPSY